MIPKNILGGFHKVIIEKEFEIAENSRDMTVRAEGSFEFISSDHEIQK